MGEFPSKLSKLGEIMEDWVKDHILIISYNFHGKSKPQKTTLVFLLREQKRRRTI